MLDKNHRISTPGYDLRPHQEGITTPSLPAQGFSAGMIVG